MKRFLYSLFLTTSLACFLFPCSAMENYSDSFSSKIPSEIASYQGTYQLVSGLFSSIGWSPPDSDGLLLTQNSSSASVTYRISGADSIQFSFYTPFAPFAAPDTEEPEKYSIGYELSSAVSGGEFQVANACRLYYCPSTQEIFFSDSGQWNRVIYDWNDYCYRAQTASPSNHLTGLFCNLYTSADGSNYQPADYRIINVHCAVQDGVSTALCYQNATASLPAGTNYIRLELTGCGRVPDNTGERLPYDQNQNIALAQVSFSGSGLIVGSPAAVPSSSESSSSSRPQEGSSSSSSKKPSSKRPSKTEGMPKYDGTGTILPGTEKSPATSGQEQQQTDTPQNSENSSAIQTQIGLPSKERSANLGYLYMTVCILVVAGVCGYCLYRQKRTEKEEKQKPPKA